MPGAGLTFLLLCVSPSWSGKSPDTPGHSEQELSPVDTFELPPMITSAGKASVPLRDTPLPTSLITEKDMRSRCASTLRDVLSEETGLTVIHDHGAGIQVQGLDPAYTLILIDGEPAIGRTAGTLDLERFAVGSLEQVEIIKGPSSSLYGSDALGGIINLVTRTPSDPLALTFRSRYGTFNALETGVGLEMRRALPRAQDSLGVAVFLDRIASDGYDLDPTTVSSSVPRFRNYTLQPKVTYAFGSATRVTVSPRLMWEVQEDQAEVAQGDSSVLAGSRSTLRDFGGSTSFEHAFSPRLAWSVKGHIAEYRTLSSLTSEQEGSRLSRSEFDQGYQKAETFLKAQPFKTHTLFLGGGGALESVEADRIAGGRREAHSGFAFLQEEWVPGPKFNLHVSGRVDAHEDYAIHFSPRVAGLVKPLPWMGLRASVGKGFKAPTFQQLYLDFTNPQAGYSVFGSTGAKEALNRLDQQGQIQTRLRELGGDVDLRPENSWSYNLGLEVLAGRRFSAQTNLFRNEVRDLIEAVPVAVKTNGQNAFTYFNLNRIRTQGIENGISLKPWRWLSLSAGYQYLEAVDEEALEDIENGRISKVGGTGRIRPVQEVEYGGLFNRSRHSGNFKVGIDFGKPGFSANLRGTYRGRYGYGDRNNNGILDDDREYVPGYSLWNATLTQRISRFLTVQAGMENILDETNPDLIPSLPGRMLYAGINLQYF